MGNLTSRMEREQKVRNPGDFYGADRASDGRAGMETWFSARPPQSQ